MANHSRGLERSEIMARSWATRKGNAAAVAQWWETPVCLCGCGQALVKHHLAKRQRRFRPGHDAKLHSVAAKVIRGDLTRDAIPEIAKALKSLIPFLKKNPNLAKAFN